jgi:hypothetical protein
MRAVQPNNTINPTVGIGLGTADQVMRVAA